MNAGLFGGSFDPPHVAHRALADTALAQLQLDAVVWTPAGQPWQKPGRALVPPADRVEMLRLVTADEARYSVDDRELRRAGPSYTIDTLRELHDEHPGTRWWLVIGQDQYARLDTWRDWREIISLAGIAVAARAGEPVRPAPGLAGCPHALEILSMPAHPHSATAVRDSVAAGLDVTALVGAPVARYIARHHLYRGDRAAA